MNRLPQREQTATSISQSLKALNLLQDLVSSDWIMVVEGIYEDLLLQVLLGEDFELHVLFGREPVEVLEEGGDIGVGELGFSWSSLMVLADLVSSLMFQREVRVKDENKVVNVGAGVRVVPSVKGLVFC